MPTTGAHRRMSNRRVMVIGGALLLIAAFGAEAAGRVLFAPWSISLGGRTTLTGPWAGSLETRRGVAFGLHLDLEYKERSGSSYRSGGALGSTNIQGHATLCTPTGDRYAYSISGKADPFGGIERLWLEYGDPRHSALDIQATGAWHGDTLALSIIKNPFLPDGGLLAAVTAGSNEPIDPDDYFLPATLTERSQAAFEATCRRIGA